MSSPYRFTNAIPKREARGLVAQVYSQLAADFLLADGPLMSMSPAPEVLAATWALLREAQVAGSAPRVEKELVAATVSVVNQCPFCVGAHTALLHGTGQHDLAETIWRGDTPAEPRHGRIVAWVRATIVPGAPELTAAPSSGEFAAEFIGTALVTHFINRMTSALVNEQALAVRLQASALVRRVAGKAFARVVRKHPAGGGSLPLLAGIRVGAPPEWAGETAIGAAYGALHSAASAGGSLLSAPARGAVRTTVATRGAAVGEFASGALDAVVASLPRDDRPGATLALLAAVAPHDIDATRVDRWRTAHPEDGDLVRLLAFGAMTAVERIEGWIIAGRRPGTRLAAAAR